MVQLALREAGQGDTIVFVHGTPTCSFEYREVFQALSAKYHCFAVDHLGFGKSAKPRKGNYQLEAHQARLKHSLKERGVRKFHLVVHDFGGVIGLPLLWDKDFEVTSLTLLNTWAWPLIETEPQMKNQRWAVRLGLFTFLYRQFNFSPRFLLKMAWGKRVPLKPELHKHYMSQFPSPDERSGPIAFMQALFDADNPVWHMKARITDLQQPVLIIWGTADKLISKRNLQRWREWLPNAKVHELDDVGHFIAEEAPRELSEQLDSFIQGSRAQ